VLLHSIVQAATQHDTQRGNGIATEAWKEVHGTRRRVGTKGWTPSTHLSTPANQDPLMCSDFTALTAKFDQGQRMCWESFIRSNTPSTSPKGASRASLVYAGKNKVRYFLNTPRITHQRQRIRWLALVCEVCLQWLVTIWRTTSITCLSRDMVVLDDLSDELKLEIC
jgi:hypothetical protein